MFGNLSCTSLSEVLQLQTSSGFAHLHLHGILRASSALQCHIQVPSPLTSGQHPLSSEHRSRMHPFSRGDLQNCTIGFMIKTRENHRAVCRYGIWSESEGAGAKKCLYRSWVFSNDSGAASLMISDCSVGEEAQINIRSSVNQTNSTV